MEVQAPWTLQNRAPQYQKKDVGGHWILRHPIGIEVSAVRSSSDKDWTVWNAEGVAMMVETCDNSKIINLMKNMIRSAVEELTNDLQIL